MIRKIIYNKNNIILKREKKIDVRSAKNNKNPQNQFFSSNT